LSNQPLWSILINFKRCGRRILKLTTTICIQNP
jgi:hypothetical protein